MRYHIQTFKTLSVVMIPAIITACLVVLLQGGKNILDGVYFLFPLIYLAQALLSTNVKWLLVGMTLTSIAFLLPIQLLYHMGSCIELVTVYLLLAGVGYLVRSLIQRKGTKKERSE